MSRSNVLEMIEQRQTCQPIFHEEIHNPHYQEYLTLAHKQWHFSDLLMMNKEKTILTNNAQKLKVLNLLYQCYQSAADALHAFYIERKPELFDAHVGESACQIRAIKLAVMLKETTLKTSTSACEHVQLWREILARLSDLILSYQIPHNQLDSQITLASFLEKYALDSGINTDYLFLLTCFVLCHYKKRVKLDVDNIATAQYVADWCISRRKGEKFIKNLQIMCSLLSVNFVLNHLTSHDENALLAKYHLQKDVLGRWILPCLFTVERVVDLMRVHQIDACFDVAIESSNGLMIDRKVIVYQEGVIKCATVHVKNQKKNKQILPMISIQAFVRQNRFAKFEQRYIACLQQLGFERIMLTNAASHPFYPCCSLDGLNKSPFQQFSPSLPLDYLSSQLERLRNLQANAMAEGLCKAYPYTLATTHISCQTA